MLSQILAIARTAFVESIRQPIFFVIVMLSGLAQVMSTWSTAFAMGYTESAEVSGDNKLLLDIGLANVFVCGMLLSAFIATAAVSREIERKTVLTVVSKPVARPIVVLGKYLGVSGAILIATVIMLIFLLLGIRHGVMSTAADDPDQPVITFALLAVGTALAAGVWCNYFYGWYFSQTAMLVMAPLCVLAYLGVLMVSKKWAFQPMGKDFKPMITIGCAGVMMAILVLTAIAVAASTRLGQVMTIVVCAGALVMGLLNNALVGKHAFQNRPVATIREAGPSSPEMAGFDEPGESYTLILNGPPRSPIAPGDSIYYGPSPNGFPMMSAPFPKFEGSLERADDLFGPGTPGRIIATAQESTTLVVRRIGERGPHLWAPPSKGDFVFTEWTRVNVPALVAWGALPNMHFYWLLDAITQNVPIPPRHLAMMMGYGLLQIGVFLSLGVLLFQNRDVG